MHAAGRGFRSPAVKASRPHKAAEVLAAIRGARQYPSRRIHGDRGTPETKAALRIRQLCANLYFNGQTHGGLSLYRLQLRTARDVASLQRLAGYPWFPARLTPTFLATYPFGTLRKITLEQIT